MAEVELPNPEELEERAEKTFSRRVARSPGGSPRRRSATTPRRNDPMFGFSPVLAVIGGVLTANGFLQLFTLPFLHHGGGH